MIKRNSEIALFIVLNVVLSCADCQSMFIMHFSDYIGMLHGSSLLSENDGLVICLLFFLTLACWLFKILIFSFLHLVLPKASCIWQVLDDFTKNLKFRFKILFFAICLDVLSFFGAVYFYTNIQIPLKSFDAAISLSCGSYLLMLGGVLTSWLAFWAISAVVSAFSFLLKRFKK